MATMTGVRYAIANVNFDESKIAELKKSSNSKTKLLELFIGDRLCVYNELDGWAYGKKFDSRDDWGSFPLSCVNFVEKSLFQSTTDGLSVIDEITRVANEWWTKIKDLMITSTSINGFEILMDSFNELLVIRRKIQSGGIPSEELSKLRIRVAKLVDHGNMLLGLDVVIREESGVPVDAESLSLLRIYESHISSHKRFGSEPREKHDNFLHSGNFSLLLTIKSVELHSKHSCEISISLYDLEKRMFTTDSYVFLWNKGGHSDLNLKALFSNFSNEDLTKRYVMVTRVVQIAPIESSNATMKKHGSEATIPASYNCRQPYAFDILEISTIFQQAGSFNEAKERVIFLNRDQELSVALKSILLTNRIPKNFVNDVESKLLISTQLIPGTAAEIKSKQPHLFSRTPAAILRRSDRAAVSIENARNELYITLLHGELSGKSSDRNIEARIHVVESNGNVIENVFETTSVTGTQLGTVYKSVVMYHTDKPQWTEPIKLLLPNSASHDIYLRILFFSRKPYDKNKSEKGAFAIAHLQLIRNAGLISDGEHELVVYKIDTPCTNFDDENVTYMSLPATRRTLKESIAGGYSKPHAPGFSLSEKSSILISTHSCSSMLTQNEHLLNVLRWRMNCVNLSHSLTALAQPIGDTEQEMIRFLSHLLDALFEIWHDRETLEKLVFDVIVAILRLCDEQRNVQAAKILEVYLKRFSYTSAALKILKCLNHYIVTDSEECNEKARNSFKVMGLLFKVVAASKKCAIRFAECNVFESNYKEYLREFMRSLVCLMGDKKPRMTVQNTALKNIPTIIDLLYESESCTAESLCGFVVDLMGNFGNNIVTRERLGFIAQIVETKFFSLPLCREQLMSPCVRIALDIIQIDNASTEKSEFADRAAECASIIAAILEHLFADAKSENNERELTIFILSVYRPLVQAMIRVIHDDKHTDDDARGHFFSVILALLDKMSAQMFSEYVEERPFDIDKRDFLMEMVQMIRDLLNRHTFPPSWKAMIMLQNKVIHKSLRFVMSAVQTFFSNDKFCAEMWQEYMMTVVSFVTQEGLDSKHEWLRQEDEDMRVQLRKAAAKDLRSMWFRLSPSQKLLYIPSMVGSFLKVSLVDDDETREATIPIFFDMMQTEYNTSSSRSFKEFASELVSQLDSLVGVHSATQSFKEQFRRLSITLCQSDKELMSNGGEELIDRIDRLLCLLIEYHEITSKPTIECADNLMSRTVQLMRYYNQYDHEELYVKYIYKLYNLHMSYGNDIEAAKTLLRHSKMLTFEEKELPQWLVSRLLNRQCATQRQLKENILQEAGNLFTKGENWEDAILVLRDLLPVYESIYVDYAKLADLMQKIAKLYTLIDTTERAFFYYYLVAFYGQGFPAYLNGHKFVFHSDKLEMHGDFMQRIMKMYDNPEKIMTTDNCPHLIEESGRYIQVFNIEPIGKECRFENSPAVNPAIKKYYRHYNINTFEYSKMEEKKDTKWTSIDGSSEFMRNWLVKRRITTSDSLPTDLRFAEVISVSEPIYVSPLQNAVEQMRKKNKDLNELATNVLYNPKTDLKLLSRDILGVANAAVMGGVKNYEVFFTEACRNVCECGEQSVIMELSSLIIEQVEILEYCCWVHASKCLTEGEGRQINDALADAFDRHRKYVEENFGRTRSRLPPNASIRLSNSHESNADVSELSGMTTLKSTKALALGNAVANLLSSNKRSSGSNSPAPLSARSAPSFDNLSSALRSSFAVSRLSSSSSAKPTPPSPAAPPTNSHHNFEGIRLRTHHPHQSSTSSMVHNTVAPPLPPRIEQDAGSKTLKRAKS